MLFPFQTPTDFIRISWSSLEYLSLKEISDLMKYLDEPCFWHGRYEVRDSFPVLFVGSEETVLSSDHDVGVVLEEGVWGTKQSWQ